MHLTSAINKVYPEFKDRYYVYALCRPNGIPFYIGKGKNSRINHHFRPSNLKINSRKVGIIKKYGSRVKLQILAYLDSENKAYDLEEHLIATYGLIEEGGVLTNYAKTRFQFSDRFVKEFSIKNLEKRKRVVPECEVLKIYGLYFTDCLSTGEIKNLTSIKYSYISQLVGGHKDKKLYEKYVLSGEIVNNRCNLTFNPRKPKTPKNQLLADEKLLEQYDLWSTGKKTVREIAEYLNTSPSHIREIFKGECRSYLFKENIGKRVYPIISNEQALQVIEDYHINQLTVADISKIRGIHKSTVSRMIKFEGRYHKFKQEYEKEN